PLGRFALQLDVVLQAHAGNHLELRLEEVDMLLLALENSFEDLAADEIAHALAMLDRVLEQRDRFHLQREIGLEDLLDRLADLELVDGLEVGKAFEKQDAVRQRVGVLHLVDRFLPLVLGELLDSPVLQHAVVQPVLVDGGEFVGERLVEVLDDLRIALHHASPDSPLYGPWERSVASLRRQNMAEILGFANDNQEPASSRDQVATARAMTYLGDHLVGVFETLAALRRLAHSGVECLGIARQVARRFTEFGFTNGIADANVHRRKVSLERLTNAN